MPSSFDPTRPPPRRLVRLGVVFDGRTAATGIPPLARMCERAGIDAVWVADAVAGTALQGELDSWSMAVGLLDTLGTARVGAMLAVVGGRARYDVSPPRLEICLLDGGDEGEGARTARDSSAAVSRSS